MKSDDWEALAAMVEKSAIGPFKAIDAETLARLMRERAEDAAAWEKLGTWKEESTL